MWSVLINPWHDHEFKSLRQVHAIPTKTPRHIASENNARWRQSGSLVIRSTLFLMGFPEATMDFCADLGCAAITAQLRFSLGLLN